MATQRQLADLLPIFFASAVERFSGKALLELERESVFQALVNSLRWSILRQARDKARDKEGAARSPSAVPTIETIETADRFADVWVTRVEVVSRIEHTSGLAPQLSHLALLLIEMQLDAALAADGEGAVSVKEVGRVRSRGAERRGDVASRASWEMERLRSRLMDELSSGPSARERSSRSRRLNPADIGRLIDILEAAEAFRAPVPYSIELAPSLALRPTTHEIGRKVDWPMTEKNRFLEQKVKSDLKGKADDSDRGLVKT